VDQVTSAGGDGGPFEPRHTVHGFRYVRVEGGVEKLTGDDVSGMAVHTDLRRVGWCSTSNDRLNRLHDAATWSFRGNACDIPTDCPTRERLGWTGDWQLFVETAAFLFDVAGFSAKWLRDLASEQLPDGRVRHIAPTPGVLDIGPSGPPMSSSGWGDAAVIVPWEIYRAYGDDGILDRQWQSMRGWVEFAAASARSGRHPSRVRARPHPAAHEEFIWDTGFHWGEWLEPGALADQTPAALNAMLEAMLAADHGPVATAYLHHSSRILARIAGILGRHSDEERYTELADATRRAWQAEFLDEHGRLTIDTQAEHVRALAFDLVPGELRPSTGGRLVELVRRAGTHLATGFLATPYLLPVLADTGHLDLAYELLLADTEPSWLTMIDRGATTVWELWNGVSADGIVCESLNHYSKGAVISFMHRYLGGIRPVDDWPAYRRTVIAPQPGGGLRWARASHDSPYGLIESHWRAEGGCFELEVAVPAGSTAEVRLPDGQTFEQLAGQQIYRCGLP
jgi:alpha-L-rhamnosidase